MLSRWVFPVTGTYRMVGSITDWGVVCRNPRFIWCHLVSVFLW